MLLLRPRTHPSPLMNLSGTAFISLSLPQQLLLHMSYISYASLSQFLPECSVIKKRNTSVLLKTCLWCKEFKTDFYSRARVCSCFYVCAPCACTMCVHHVCAACVCRCVCSMCVQVCVEAEEGIGSPAAGVTQF